MATAIKESRLSLRIDEGTKALLSRAATARRVSLTQFIVDVARDVAERETRPPVESVSAEEYHALLALMDRPPVPSPELVRLLQEKPAWDA